MNQNIQIRNRTLGVGPPLFIMAECGVTCNYDMEITKKLIDVVKDAGADAIKFIFWFPEEIMSDKEVVYQYQTVNGPRSENMFEMLNGLRFSLDQWKEIKDYADSQDIILFSTVNSPSGIEFAEELALEAYKLSSWDYGYIALWERIAALGKPMLIDTGPVNLEDVKLVVDIMKKAGNEDAILVHCFHTDNYDEMNMRAIPFMKETFDCVVGFSATDFQDEMDMMALGLGATVLEKRLTLSRKLPGHHHILSNEPEEFNQYVNRMRELYSALGKYELKPSQADLEERKKFFRHLVANRDLSKGTVITEDMLEAKRPESGISPVHWKLMLGKTVLKDLKYNQAISWDDLSES